MGKGYPRDFEVPGNTVHLVVTTVEWEGGLNLLGQNAQHRRSGSHEETLFQNKIRKKKMQAGKCAEVRVGEGRWRTSHGGCLWHLSERDFNRDPSERQRAGSPMCLSSRPSYRNSKS